LPSGTSCVSISSGFLLVNHSFLSDFFLWIFEIA
jgi:hypothetical protein